MLIVCVNNKCNIHTIINHFEYKPHICYAKIYLICRGWIKFDQKFNCSQLDTREKMIHTLRNNQKKQYARGINT